MSNVSFTIGGVFYLLLLLIVCIIKKIGLLKVENKVYFSLIVVAIIGSILDSTLFFLNIFNVSIYSHLYLILTKLMLCYYDIWCFLFLLYIIAVLLRKKGTPEKFDKYKKILFFILLPILIILNFILPIDFIVQNNTIFPLGINVIICYLNALISIVIMVCLLMKNKKYIRDKEFIPLWIVIILSIITIFIQIVFPGLILMTAMESMATFIMFFTIENPDIKMIEQLNIAKDQADKANQAKSDFLSSMSHEIRTPLNAIVGFSQALSEEDLPESAKEEVQDIIMASNGLLEIVNGILDISKIESGKIEIVNSEYDFKEIFNNLVSLTKARMGESVLDFRTHYDDSIPAILYGDHTRVKQVILNILTNAIKYTKEGYVDFRVSSIIKDDICRLIISVEDTGIGIKEENIDKLFSKFERLDVDKNITIEGTGLGLAITKKLVELMSGKIVVQSIYGKGSKFTISIDQRIIKKEVVKAPEILEEKAPEHIDASNKRVLIVDDNKINLKVAARLLQNYHVITEEVESGFACLEKIEQGQVYDLILMDDMMPKMSGIDTLKKLKEMPNFNTKVIALTANAISGMKEKYLKEGFDDYLAKPIDRQELNKIVAKYLSM